MNMKAEKSWQQSLSASQVYLWPLMLIFQASSSWHKISSITEISLYLLVALAAVSIIRHKFILFTDFSFDVFLKVFLFWCFVTIFASANVNNSLHDWYRHLLLPLFVLYLVASLCITLERVRTILSVVAITLVILMTASVIYFYGLEHHPIGARLNVIQQTGMSINSVGVIAIIPFFIGIYWFVINRGWWMRIIWGAVLVITMSTVFLSGTRWALVGLILPLPLVLYRLNKRIALSIIVVGLIIGFLSPMSKVLTPTALTLRVKEMERPAIWHLYGLVVKDHPVMGIGFGMQNYTQDLYLKYIKKLPKEQQFIRHARYFTHNMFLDLAVRTGLPGVFIFLFGVVAFVFRSLFLSVKAFTLPQDRRLILSVIACLLSIVIQCSMTDLFLTRYYYLFYLLIGIAAALEKIAPQRKTLRGEL